MNAAATGTRGDLWAAFSARASALGATVQGPLNADEAQSVLSALGEGGRHGPGARRDFAPFLPASAQVVGVGAPAERVVAAGAFAVAETGSVLLAEEHDGRQAAFLSEQLWLLVRADAIVSTLDEALQRVAAAVKQGSPYLTFMSGPSRTADIERTLTIGVHGPRELTILVVEEADA